MHPSTARLNLHSADISSTELPVTMRIITPPSAVLRDWTREDAPSLAQHADNPRIASLLRDGFPSPYTLEDADRFIAVATEPGKRRLFLAIDVDGEACGGIGINLMDDV